MQDVSDYLLINIIANYLNSYIHDNEPIKLVILTTAGTTDGNVTDKKESFAFNNLKGDSLLISAIAYQYKQVKIIYGNLMVMEPIYYGAFMGYPY